MAIGGLETAAPCADSALITRRKLRRHAEGSAQFAAGRNHLDSLLLFKRALLMVIGQSPARLDAQKWAAVRPQRHVRHLSLIHISEPTRLLSISYAVFCL